LTLSPPAVLLGAQAPRLHSAPAGTEDSGRDAVEFAAQAGLHLDPWQQLVLRQALRERDGKWSAFEVGLVVPRQNGKGSVLEALELFLLFLPDPDAPPPLILHSAHEFKTSAEHFRRMRDLIEGTPHLNSKVRIIRTAAGSESIELHSGARLRFVTRTGGSGRGFSADTIVIDEAYNLTPEAMAAVLPTMSARPNPQVWYTSSAGMTSSSQLRRIRERGVQGSSRLAYFEWSAPDDADLEDRQAWAQANPALGIRIPAEFVEAELEAMPAEQFARERLGIWQNIAGESSAFDVAKWEALHSPAERGGSLSFAVATAPDRSWSAISAAWRREDGHMQVELVDYHAGAAWVWERADQLRGRWGARLLVTNAARGLLADAEEPSQAEQAQAHNALADAIEAGTVRHGNQPALNVAVSGSRWRPYGDTRVLDRKGGTDISPIDAAALALWQARAGRDADFFTI
jgi:hypothetical protein